MDDNVKFMLYVGALMLTSVLLLILVITGLGKPAKSERVINGLIGLAAGGYGIYLMSTVFIDGGEYRPFLGAYVLPFFAAYQIYKGLKVRKAEQGQQAASGNPIQR